MSETDLGRALQFMQEPQDVEVYRCGDWVLGSMIGWRREEGGSCRIMVRLTERGAEKTAWADLQDVRLPENGAFPGTQSLPFLPSLPQGCTERPASTATTSSREEPLRPLNFVAPVNFDDSRADARDRSTSPETGHDRASARFGRSPSGATVGEVAVSSASSMQPHRDAEEARASGWPVWDGPADSPEVEPTRLLTLRRPRRR